MTGATFAVYGLVSMLVGAIAMLVPVVAGVALVAGYALVVVLVGIASGTGYD